jgi:hypothetical protein
MTASGRCKTTADRRWRIGVTHRDSPSRCASRRRGAGRSARQAGMKVISMINALTMPHDMSNPNTLPLTT